MYFEATKTTCGTTALPRIFHEGKCKKETTLIYDEVYGEAQNALHQPPAKCRSQVAARGYSIRASRSPIRGEGFKPGRKRRQDMKTLRMQGRLFSPTGRRKAPFLSLSLRKCTRECALSEVSLFVVRVRKVSEVSLCELRAK